MSKFPQRLAKPGQYVLMLVAGLLGTGAGFLLATGTSATPSDWFGLIGGLFGAALTVAGGILILEWQRTRELREKRRLLTELLNDVEFACAGFHQPNEAALIEARGITVAEQVREVRHAISRVHRFRERMTPETADMMRAADLLEGLDFQSPEIDAQLTSIAFYPESADLGGLNYEGHAILTQVNEARKLIS